MQQCIKILIILYLYEARHVSGDTPPVIRSLKLHWQLLVFHTWKFIGRVVDGRCRVEYEKMHLLILCLTSTNYTANSLPRMKNQRLPVQF